MKHFKHLCMLFAAMLLSINVWGETATLTFTAACGGTGTDDKGNTWTVTSDAAESVFDSDRGVHYGTSKVTVSYLRLTSSSFSGTITKVVVNASDGNSTAKINVSVGGQDFGAQTSAITSSNAAYTFEPTTAQSSTQFSGVVYVNISRTSVKKALYVKSIEVTYTSGGSENPTVYSVTLMDNETELTEESAGAGVELPIRTTTCDGYTFAGWSETNCATETTTAPTIIEAGDYKPSKNIELYPVFKKTVGDDGFKLSIVYNGTTYYVGAKGSGAYLNAVTSANDAAVFYLATEGTTNYLYYLSGTTKNYLSITADNTSLIVNTTKPTVSWTVSEAGGTISFATTATGNRNLAWNYNGGTPRFASYKGSSSYLYQYTKHANGVSYYIAAPTCVIPTVEKPTLSLAAGEYWGTQNVKVSNYNSENTYYYTLNGDEPDNTSTAYVDAEGINVTASSTLKVIAYNGAETSTIASADYTIKPQFASLEELVAADLASNTEVKVSFSNVKIKDFYLNGSSVKKGVYFDIQKEGKDIEIYVSSVDVPNTWQVNGKLSIENLTCIWTRYVKSSVFQCWELTPTNWDGFNYTAAPTLDRVVVTGDASKKGYVAGEKFNTDGLVVTAYDTEDAPEVITSGITWAVTPERVDNGVSSVSVMATYNGKTSEAYTVSGLTTTPVQNGTITDFITNEGGRCYLTGVVSDIATSGASADKKCVITNGESSITIYGILAADRTASTFSALGIEDGDKIKVIAEEYTVYSGTKQAVNVEFVEEIVLSSIAISGELSNTTYTSGDAFNYSGLTATGTYTDGSTSDLTSKVTWSIEPASLIYGMSSVTVKATMGEINGTKNCDITVIKKTAEITIDDMEIGIADANVAIEATTTPADAELTFTIVSGEEYITLADGKVSAKAEGTAVVKASFAGNDEYDALDKNFNVKVSNVLIAKKLSFVSGDNTGSHNFTDNTDISFEAFKGEASTAPYLNDNTLRLYQSGGYITIKGSKGVKIQSVELTTTATFNSTTVGYCVDEEDAPTTGETVAKSSTYTISDLDNQSVSIYCLGTSKDTRLEIASLIVKYTKEVIALDHIALSGTYTTDFFQNGTFNHDGVVVTATYSDNDEQDVTSSAVFSTPDMTNIGTETVMVTYTEGGIEKTASYDITISEELATALTLGGEYATRFREGDEFNHTGLTIKAEYNSGRKNIDVTEAVTVSTPDLTTAGVKTVTVSYTYNEKTITKDYTIQVVPASAVFYESFDSNDGTGGNDDQWSGSIASNTIKYDNEGWSCSSASGANKCAKFGAGSSLGSAITPALGYTGNATLTFKAAAWNGNNENTTLKLSMVNGGRIAEATVTLEKGAWTSYTIDVTLVEASKIKFESNSSSNSRFFLDEVMVVAKPETKEIITGLTPGKIGTYCAEQNVTNYEGATFYVPEFKTMTAGLATAVSFVEVTTLEAGHAYIYVANAATITGVVSGEPATVAVTNEALVGTLEAEGIDPYIPADYVIYIIYNGELRPVAHDANLHVAKGKAYLNMGALDEEGSAAPAPGRRIVLGTQGSNTATGLDNVEGNANVQKVLVNGNIYILRGEKMFNINGQLVK